MKQETLDLFDVFSKVAVESDEESKRQAFQAYILLQPILTTEERMFLSLLRLGAAADPLTKRDFLDACRIVRARIASE